VAVTRKRRTLPDGQGAGKGLAYFTKCFENADSGRVSAQTELPLMSKVVDNGRVFPSRG
jgi:hypothetical protein